MKIEKVNKIITVLVRCFIVFLIVWTVLEKNYNDTAILILTMGLTFYDVLLQKIFGIFLDSKLKIAIILFLLGTQCFGSVVGLYDKIPIWDTVLHGLSGILFFFIGITLGKEVNRRTTKANISLPLILLFGICFALAIGVVWEIFEFTIDGIFQGNMQVTKGFSGRAAVMDTMLDLVSAVVGSIIAMIIEIRIRKKKNK